MLEFLSTFAGALLHMLALAAPYVVIGFVIAGAIREFVPTALLARHFGERGFLPVAKATGTGALIPVCSCGVIPIGVGAFHSGAARGTVLAFLTAAPALSPVAAVLAFQLLGTMLALSLIGGVIVGSLVLGLVANRVLGGHREIAFRESRGLTLATSEAKQTENAEKRPLPRRIGRMFHWAFLDFGAKLGAQLLIGLVLAALIIALIPPDWIHGFLGQQTIWTVLAVLVVAVPIYTCSVPSIAVVLSLLLLGMSPGAAVAFLIAGPATNLAELNAVRAQLGASTAALYLGGLIVVALGAGVFTDQVIFPNYQYEASEIDGVVVVESCCVPLTGSAPTLGQSIEEMVSHIPAWHLPFLVLLAPILVLGLVSLVRGRNKCASGKQQPKASCCGSQPSGGAGAHAHTHEHEHGHASQEEALPRYRPNEQEQD